LTRRASYLTVSLINGLAKHAVQTSDRLSSTFSALADPTRRAILARLSRGETSVKELAAPFDMSLPAVSRHLKVLEKAGLIARSRDAQWRPCRLEAGPLRDIAGWVEEYRRFWEESFDRLDEYLRELQAQPEHQAPPQPKEKRRARKK
jgi:DNA-binding transcriptional ArsR family regulator